MNTLHNLFISTRLSIWLLVCALILAATSVYAAGDQRPLAAVDILGSPDAAVDGKFAVGTTTPGNKALTVAGVIDFVGAGTVHNYFTQGPGNNMQIRSNVDEYNAVGNSSYAQWNMVMGASLDVFSIRRSPASSTYNEDALFWIEGNTGRVGIATVDTSNGATIPFTLNAKLHVETTSGDAVKGVSTATSGFGYGVVGETNSTDGRGVFGWAHATIGEAHGVVGQSDSTFGWGTAGLATATSGNPTGVYGRSASPDGIAVYGWGTASSGYAYGVYGQSDSSIGRGVYGYAFDTSSRNYGVYGESMGTMGVGVYGVASATTGNEIGPTVAGVMGISQATNVGTGVFGYSAATSGVGVGVSGVSNSTDGRAVDGFAQTTTGTNFGVYGESLSTSGYDFYAAGVGTDYGPFTGAHEVRLADSFPVDVKPGMIVSATGETQIRRTMDGDVDLSSTLPTVQLADKAEDKAVLGVLVAEITLPEDHWYEAEENERFASVNALGEGRVRVTNINGNIEAGDYITTSDIPGYGQRQSNENLRGYTLAKATDTINWDLITETVNFNGQEYKIYLLAVVYTSG
jgi:hypothetical protein